jgi:hypothetical protein
MKLFELFLESDISTTSASSIASISKPLGGVRRRSDPVSDSPGERPGRNDFRQKHHKRFRRNGLRKTYQ